VPHYSSVCEGVMSSTVELTTVLVNLDPVLVSWRFLCPNRSGFEGRGVVVAVRSSSADRLEGAIDGGPYEVQLQAWQRPVPTRSNSAGVDAAVRGVALQGRG
jgi:hypothetical protein